MKYLYLLLVLGLGYEGFTHWSELQSAFDRGRAQITGKASAQPAADPVVTPGQLIPGQPVPGQPVPGQPVAPGQSVSSPTAAVPAAGFASRVAESQHLAVAKYPALGVAHSEMNSRFVFRYKNLVKDKSPRLQEPTWPLQLADECNASVVASAPAAKKPAADKPRSPGSLASAVQTAAH